MRKKPIIKVRDPKSIKAIEIPRKSKPKAAADIWGWRGGEEEEEEEEERERLGKEMGSGGERRT